MANPNMEPSINLDVTTDSTTESTLNFHSNHGSQLSFDSQLSVQNISKQHHSTEEAVEYIDAERPVVLNKSTLSAPASTNNVTRQARPAGSPGPPRMDLDRKDGIAEDEDDSTLNLERDENQDYTNVVNISTLDLTTEFAPPPLEPLNQIDDHDDHDHDNDHISNASETMSDNSEQPYLNLSIPPPNFVTPNEAYPLQALSYEQDLKNVGTKDAASAWCHAHIWEHLWRKQTEAQHIKMRTTTLQSDTISSHTTAGACPLFSIPETLVIPPTPWTYDDWRRPRWYFSSTKQRGTPILKKKRRRNDLLGFSPREVFDQFSKMHKTTR